MSASWYAVKLEICLWDVILKCIKGSIFRSVDGRKFGIARLHVFALAILCVCLGRIWCLP